MAKKYKAYGLLKDELKAHLAAVKKARKKKWIPLSSGKFVGRNGEPSCPLCAVVSSHCDRCPLKQVSGGSCGSAENAYDEWDTKKDEVTSELYNEKSNVTWATHTRNAINTPEVVALAKLLDDDLVRAEEMLTKLIKVLS